MFDNPRIKVKKDNSRAVTASAVANRPTRLPISVMRPETKASRGHKVHPTQIGARPVDALQPTSVAVAIRG